MTHRKKLDRALIKQTTCVGRHMHCWFGSAHGFVGCNKYITASEDLVSGLQCVFNSDFGPDLDTSPKNTS